MSLKTLGGVSDLIKDISSTADSKKIETIEKMFSTMPQWAQEITKSSSSFKSLDKSTQSLIAGTEAVEGMAVGVSASATGMASLGSAIEGASLAIGGFLIEFAPFIAAFTAIGIAIKLASDKSHEFENSLKNASDSFGDYTSAKNELNNLQSELDTTKDRLSELQELSNSGKITIAERAEYEQLQRTNSELERKIALQEQSTSIATSNAVNDTVSVLSAHKSSTQDVQNVYDPAYGTYVSQYVGSQSNTILDEVEQKITEINKIQKEYDGLWEDWNKAESGSRKQQDIQNQLDEKQNALNNSKNELGKNIEDIQNQVNTLQTAVDDGYKLSNTQQNYLDDAYKALNKYSSMNATSNVEENLKNIQSYFSANQDRNTIKDYLVDAAKSGETASDALSKLGLTLNDIGIKNKGGESDFNAYFEELAKAAKNAEKVVKETGTSIEGSMSGIATAMDSQNSGDSFKKLNEYLDTAKKLFDSGEIGTDDFKSVAKMIASDGTKMKDAVKNFSDNYENIKKYFTTDDSGNFTKTGIDTFVSDLKGAGKTFKNTADAADALGISTESVEVILDRLGDYGISVNKLFDNKKITKSAEAFSEAKTSLEGLQEAYNKLEDGENKQDLGKKLKEWKSQINDASKNGLSDFDTTIAVKIQAELDRQQILSKIQELEGLIQKGGGNAEQRAERNLTQASLLKTDEKTAGGKKWVNRKDNSAYKSGNSATSSLDDLLTLDLDDKQTKIVQDAEDAVQDAQEAFVNAWNEAKSKDNKLSFNDWLDTDNAKELNKNIKDSVKEANKIIDKYGNKGKKEFKFEVDADTSEAEDKVEKLDNTQMATKLVELNAEDNATDKIELWNGLSADPKFTELTANDQASFVVDTWNGLSADPIFTSLNAVDKASTVVTLWNGLSTDPKFTELSAEDKASIVIETWNRLSPEEKDAVIQGKDNATNVIKKVSAEQIQDKYFSINANDNASGIIGGIRGALSGLKDKVINIVTNKTTNYSSNGKNPPFNGTAHAFGTAKANGDWSVKSNQTSLINEVGREVIVRDGKWFDVNNGYPAFTKLKKGDIVFNHKQTEELFKNGYITNSHAKIVGGALANGTVQNSNFRNGFPAFASGTLVGGTAFASGSDSDKVLENFKKWLEKFFDWIEIRLDRTQRKIDTAITRAEYYSDIGKYNSSRKQYRRAITYNGKQVKYQQKAYNEYYSQARDTLNKASKDFGWSSKKKSTIWNEIKKGTLDIKKYDERTREAISSTKEWYEKARDAKQTIYELRKECIEYVNALNEVADAQAETKLDRLNLYSDVITSNAGYTSAEKNNILKYQNSQLDKEIEIEESKLQIKKQNYSTGKKKAKTILTSEIKAQKKNSDYKKALKSAKEYIKQSKSVPQSVLKVIAKNNQEVYQRLIEYNQFIENLEIAKLERDALVAKNEAQKSENILEMRENIVSDAESKTNKYKTLSEASDSLSDKNNYIMQSASQYDNIVAYDRQALADTTADLTNAGNKVAKYTGHSTNWDGLSDKTKENAQKWIDRAKSYVSQNKFIPANVIDKIVYYNEKHAINNKFKNACIAWNNAFTRKEQLEESLEIDEATAKIEKQNAANEAFQNIQDQYEAERVPAQAKNNKIDAYISNAEAKGYVASTKYYEALNKNLEAQKPIIENEIAAMDAAIKADLASGSLTYGSVDYYNRISALNNLLAEAIDIDTQIAENIQKMNEINWEKFDKVEEKISRIVNEANFLIELMDSEDMFDDNGKITDYGMATVGLHMQNYETYTQQAKDYADAISEINQQLASDEYNENLIKRKEELIDKQQEAILNAKNEKDAIKDLIEDGIDKELDALDELIDKYTDALEAGEDLYSYQKNIRKEAERVAQLQKQLKAYEGDTSEEAKATVQQLTVDLKEAQEDLEETQHDRLISETRKIISDLYDEYEDILNNRLDNIDVEIEKIVATLDENYDVIIQTIEGISGENGYTLSGVSESIYNASSSISDAIMSAISEVKSFVEAQYAAANSNASSNLSNVDNNTDYSQYAGSGSQSSGSYEEIIEPDDDDDTDENDSKLLPPYVYPWKTEGNPKANDGLVQIGDKVTLRAGKVYEMESKGGAVKEGVGTEWKGKTVYVDAVSKLKDAPHPFHISADKEGKKDIGWVALSQLSGYATGKKKIDNNQFAWTQENGSEFIVRPSDGAILTPLAQGDSVLKHTASNNIWDMANNPSDFIKSNLGFGEVPVLNNGNNQSVVQNFDNITFSMPDIKNYEEIISAMRNDKHFEKLIQSMSIDRLNGKSSLRKHFK